MKFKITFSICKNEKKQNSFGDWFSYTFIMFNHVYVHNDSDTLGSLHFSTLLNCLIVFNTLLFKFLMCFFLEMFLFAFRRGLS